MKNLYTRSSQGDIYKIKIESINEGSLLTYYTLLPLNKDLQDDLISVCMVNETLNTELQENGYSFAFNNKGKI